MNTRKKTLKSIIDIYNERYKRYGFSPKSLGWDKNRARLRFNILTSLWNLDNMAILDFGCGFGDFYDFLIHDKDVKHISYTGIDINPEFINIAKSRFPYVKFLVRSDPGKIKFDYVFASGIFNDKIPDAKKHIRNTIKMISHSCRKGFAINFLSDKVQYTLPHANHTDPAWIVSLCYKFSNNIVLRNDYMPFEFTVFVDLSTHFDKQLVIYSNFLKKHKQYTYTDLP